MDDGLLEVGSGILETLLHSVFILNSSGKDYQRQLEYLKTMEGYNFVSLKGADTWMLTEFGKGALQQTERLKPTRWVMRPEGDTFLADATVLELLLRPREE